MTNLYELESLDGLLCRVSYTTMAENDNDSIDKAIAAKLVDFKLVHDELYYHAHNMLKLKLTCERVNALTLEQLAITSDWYSLGLGRLHEIYNNQVKDCIVDGFLAGTKGMSVHDVCRYIRDGYPGNLKLLEFAVNDPKRIKHYSIQRIIKCAFLALRTEDVDAGCVIVSKLTPATQTIMLLRTDINEVHLLKGLKAMSKLSRSRKVNAVLKLEMFKRISPKSRLQVIKHVMGYSSRYRYWTGRNIAQFDVMPTKEQLAELLFSCSMKYTSQVTEVLSHYDSYLALIKQGESNE
jgi:hypothetical protein